jgi:diguanylate cyclase
MTGSDGRKKSAKKQTTRTRIFVWALLLCAFIGAIELPLPLEDAYRGVRNQLRARPADQSVVVVAYDSKTSGTLGNPSTARAHYAQMLDQAFSLGAKRVYFDEVFSQPSDAKSDQIFADALSRHADRTFIGAMFDVDRMTGKTNVVLPAPIFRDRVRYRSLQGDSTPLALSAELVFGSTDKDRSIPSLTSDLAGRTGAPDQRYRPDWTIQANTVPTVSFSDLALGKVSADMIAGKDIIVGVTTEESDYVNVYLQGWFHGSYVQAVGAQTLKEGQPRNIGWIPALLVASLLSAAILRSKSRRKSGLIIVFAAALALAMPFILDLFLISADFFAAFFMFGIVAYRSGVLRDIMDARLKNAGSLLPNLSALREEPLAASQPIIAMRIRNYAAVCSSFATPVEDELVAELSRRMSLPDQPTTFYQAEDVLYWLGSTLSREELEDHLLGLARLIESHFELQDRKVDVHVAFGVDINLDRPVANRIGRALLAADNAASRHQLMQFNTNASDEDAAWEISLMSELDAAIDAGDIWIAYQPQFELAGDTINGAEALVRWQHPTRGAISPEAFVLPAESHNRIKRLTFHILEQATRAAKPLLQANPGFRLSVNISASLLEQAQLPAQIAKTLIETGFPASNLTLEVTESAPFSEHGVVASNLNGIAALGVDLSIDDYGTGNATLEYLRTVPCQEIKIDRRFVGGLATNPSDMLLVESTIELAHGLGRRVIAEGIEDPETLETLRAIGCDIAQGYYLARPMKIDALAELLDSKHRRTKAA